MHKLTKPGFSRKSHYSFIVPVYIFWSEKAVYQNANRKLKSKILKFLFRYCGTQGFLSQVGFYSCWLAGAHWNSKGGRGRERDWRWNCLSPSSSGCKHFWLLPQAGEIDITRMSCGLLLPATLLLLFAIYCDNPQLTIMSKWAGSNQDQPLLSNLDVVGKLHSSDITCPCALLYPMEKQATSGRRGVIAKVARACFCRANPWIGYMEWKCE